MVLQKGLQCSGRTQFPDGASEGFAMLRQDAVFDGASEGCASLECSSRRQPDLHDRHPPCRCGHGQVIPSQVMSQ